MTAPNDVTAGREVPEQRRILAVLVFSQILSGAGLAAGITVGALLAEEMLGSTGLAGVPSALFTAGSALGALGVGQICRRYGRRPGLALGYAVGALGSLGVVVAATLGSAVLLFLSLVVYGAGTSTNLMARYAGADLASAERRGRAVSTVLFATTLGAVVGPNLVTFTGRSPTPGVSPVSPGRSCWPSPRSGRRRWCWPRCCGPIHCDWPRNWRRNGLRRRTSAPPTTSVTSRTLNRSGAGGHRHHGHDSHSARDDRDHDDDAGPYAGARP